MTLVTVMYHRAQAGPYGNPPAMLDTHFAYIAKRCACVLPGEPLATDRLNVCLSFDDAYYDFYSIVFPLLEKHNLRTVLAVAPTFIREKASFPAETRTHAPVIVGEAQSYPDGHCTWPELATLAASGRVAIAAHGLNHCPLDADDLDLDNEIVVPRVVLGAKLGQPVDSFVFPFGRFSAAALHRVKQHYRYAFRIGGATQRDWSGGLIYRINGDGLAAPDALFTPPRLAWYQMRRQWNRWRGR